MNETELAVQIGIPFEKWAYRCHEISLKILRTGFFGKGRVARGNAEGVGSQHSWIILGDDVYDPEAEIVDPTLWAYRPDLREIWQGPNLLVHHPAGLGNIWRYGRPQEPTGEPVSLTPREPLSPAVQGFLKVLGPLDRIGWGQLANGPMQGFPAGEIIAAMDDTPALRALIPVDRLGMLTDRNPGGLYR
jgi:hypothetical protein